MIYSFIGLKLKNPVFVASGIAGFGDEYSPVFDINILGGLITKTITLEPRKGNPSPRILETPSGMINTIGLENPGIDKFISEKIPVLKKIKTKVIVSIGGDKEEMTEILNKLRHEKFISAVELNLSCPNVREKKCLISQHPGLTYETVKQVCRISKFPVITKLSPAVANIAEIAGMCKKAGADAVTLINTFPAMAFSRESGKYFITGGLSGPAIKPIALRMVYEVAKEVKIPIMGCGGISSAEDAKEFMLAGASAVAVGSGLFKNPNLAKEIVSNFK